jgi:hypothetical protein
MYYVISFDGCGLESPLRSRSIEAALALAEEAERNGCENVLVTAPGGEVLPFRQFARLYRNDGPRPEEA